MKIKNTFFVIVAFFSSCRADVSFSREEALMRKEKVEVLVSQTNMKSKIAIGLLAAGGAFITHYYFPNILSSFPFFSQESATSASAQATVVPQDLMIKINEAASRFSKEQIEILRQLADKHGNELGQKNLLHKAWDIVKQLAPFVIAQPVFGYIDSGRSALVNACFPNITLSWFIQSQTRVVYFGLLLEENVKLLQQERDKEKIASLEVLTKDALECFVDYSAFMIGYMYWRAEKTMKDDAFIGQKLQNVADATCDALSSFCREMNILLSSREGHIGLLGRVESFSEELDYNVKMFMICENEVLTPIGQRRPDFAGESYKDSVGRARKRLFPKSV